MVFLVDGKLVLLQPSTNDDGELKYDMRVIAHNVEYYTLARDTPALYSSIIGDLRAETTSGDAVLDGDSDPSLRDSLWLFDGQDVRVWTDVHDLLTLASAEYGKEVPPPISIPVAFYPLPPLLLKGILFGVEAELTQRRDASFALFHTVARVGSG